MSIKNVILTGASGALGTPILEKLLASPFNITVLRRTGSKATFPSDVKVVDADFDSLDSLTAALKGQDVLISTVGSPALGSQKIFVDAAIAAGIKRFLPSEFGCDLSNPKAKLLPVFQPKVELEEYIFEKVKAGASLTYTLVSNAAFLDWGLQYDFLLKVSDGKPIIYDGGDNVFSATTLATVADAVVSILQHPEETANRIVRIKDVDITQNKLLALAKKAAPEKSWETTDAKLDDVVAAADARLAKGLFDAETFVPYIFRALHDPSYGPRHVTDDNELLGLKGKTEEEVFEIVKKYAAA